MYLIAPTDGTEIEQFESRSAAHVLVRTVTTRSRRGVDAERDRAAADEGAVEEAHAAACERYLRTSRLSCSLECGFASKTSAQYDLRSARSIRRASPCRGGRRVEPEPSELSLFAPTSRRGWCTMGRPCPMRSHEGRCGGLERHEEREGVTPTAASTPWTRGARRIAAAEAAQPRRPAVQATSVVMGSPHRGPLGELKQIFELFDGDADGLLNVAESAKLLKLPATRAPPRRRCSACRRRWRRAAEAPLEFVNIMCRP